MDFWRKKIGILSQLAYIISVLYIRPEIMFSGVFQFMLGKVSKTPGTETFRWGGTPPPPWGLHGREFSEKLAEKS